MLLIAEHKVKRPSEMTRRVILSGRVFSWERSRGDDDWLVM